MQVNGSDIEYVIGGSLESIYWLVWSFCPTILDTWWGPLSVFCQSVNVHAVVVLFPGGGDTYPLYVIVIKLFVVEGVATQKPTVQLPSLPFLPFTRLLPFGLFYPFTTFKRGKGSKGRKVSKGSKGDKGKVKGEKGEREYRGQFAVGWET